MSLIITLARLVAIAASGFLLLSIANGTAQATKATGADLDAIYALALGVFVTAGIIGIAISAKRYALGGFLIFCLLCGEGYNFVKTAEREIASRETTQSATDTVLLSRETMRGTIKDAKAELTKAQQAVRDNAAAKSCLANCVLALGNAVIAAQAALDDANAEYAKTTRPPSTNGLAERSGFAAWMIDLLAAALKSLAMNGLAAGLVAFGAHGVVVPVQRKSRDTAQPEPVRELPRIIVSDEPEISPEAIFEAKKASALAIGGGITDEELAAVARLFRNDGEPDGSGPGGGGKVIRPRRWHRDEVRADLTERLARGEQFPSQRAMAAMYAVPTSTLSEWFSAWSSEGLTVKRQQIGRRKRVG